VKNYKVLGNTTNIVLSRHICQWPLCALRDEGCNAAEQEDGPSSGLRLVSWVHPLNCAIMISYQRHPILSIKASSASRLWPRSYLYTRWFLTLNTPSQNWMSWLWVFFVSSMWLKFEFFGKANNFDMGKSLNLSLALLNKCYGGCSISLNPLLVCLLINDGTRIGSLITRCTTVFLVDPQKADIASRKVIARTQSHEVVHMW
jgi:hypothetical protein